MATYTIQDGQTLFDLALQLYGDVTQAITICKNNPLIIPNLLTKNLTGLVITYDVQTNEVVKNYSSKNIIIATRYPEYTTNAAAFTVAFSPQYVLPPPL